MTTSKNLVRNGIGLLIGFIVALVIQEAYNEEGDIFDGVADLVASYLALFYLLAVVGAIVVRMF